MAAIDQVPTTMDAGEAKFLRELGARLAEARKAQRMTQVQLADALGIAQQTLAHYEGGRIRIQIATLAAMAQVLRFSIDDMLIGRTPGRARRGPASKLEQQLDAIAQLPKAKQRFVIDMLDTVLAQSR
jgi:transcriptional regulator with XRE-family HTH domain